MLLLTLRPPLMLGYLLLFCVTRHTRAHMRSHMSARRLQTPPCIVVSRSIFRLCFGAAGAFFLSLPPPTLCKSSALDGDALCKKGLLLAQFS